MPQKRYRATDSQTGETFAFDWFDDTDPTDDDIEEIAASRRGQKEPTGPKVTEVSADEPDNWWSGFLRAAPRDIGKEALKQAPMLGAAGATLATGGTALPLFASAVLGGAGGAGIRSAARQLRTGTPESAGSVAGEMALEGAGQGALEAIPPALRGMGKGLVHGALRVSGRAARDFPKLADTVIDEVIPIGMKGRTGKKLGEASADTTAALIRAEQAGASPVLAPRIARELSPAMDRAVKLSRVDPDAGQAALAEIARLEGAIPAQQSLREANAYKQTAGELAHDFFQKRNTPGGSPLDVSDLIHGGLERGARGAIEENAAAVGVPNIRELNARTQGLIGLDRAQKVRPPSEGQLHPLAMRHLIAAGLGGGAGWSTGDPMTGLKVALLAEGVANPTVLSSLGIAAGQAGKVPANVSRAAIMAALTRLMSSHEDTAR